MREPALSADFHALRVTMLRRESEFDCQLVGRFTVYLCGQQFERASDLEAFGDLMSQAGHGDCCRGFGREADHPFAIGGEDLGVDAPGDGSAIVAFGGAVDANGDLASATERVEDGALDINRKARFRLNEGGDGAANMFVAGGLCEDSVTGGASLKRKRALGGSGQSSSTAKRWWTPVRANSPPWRRMS